ncbi:hypothetical protein MMC08_006075 [Hypocenomyce scalaris]|nr:hypothetical protein [Hypocenomyce scalaris]
MAAVTAFFLLFALCLQSFAAAQTTTSTASEATYTNPILNGPGADPWVIRNGDYYYMTFTETANITMLRSKVLTDWNNADQKLVFSPPTNASYSYDLWAPELHNIDGLWYIIFSADEDADSPPADVDMLCTYSCPAVFHRMFVLESSGADPWESDYVLKSQLNTFDQFAIDGTYFQHATGLYHIYSCWYEKYISWPSMLCITQMSNPWTVSSTLAERSIISIPTNWWEKTPHNRTINDRLSSNEGPEQLTNPATNQTFVIYSAARSTQANYCLGLLELVGADPMDPGSWVKNDTGCVFYQNGAQDTYGVGHASFTQSQDGEEDWMVYHGMADYVIGSNNRSIRTQQFSWDNNTGAPLFPRPGLGPYPVPAGQQGIVQVNNGTTMGQSLVPLATSTVVSASTLVVSVSGTGAVPVPSIAGSAPEALSVDMLDRQQIMSIVATAYTTPPVTGLGA